MSDLRPDSESVKIVFHPLPKLKGILGGISFLFAFFSIGFFYQNETLDPYLLVLTAVFLLAWLVVKSGEQVLILERTTQRLLIQNRWSKKILHQSNYDNQIVILCEPSQSAVLLFRHEPIVSTNLITQIPARGFPQAQRIEHQINVFLGRAIRQPNTIFSPRSGDWRTFAGLITIANVAIYIVASLLHEEALFDLNRADFFDGEYWRLISHMFMHVNSIHLAVNSMALINLGVFLERLLGFKRVALIYFASGLGGGVYALFWLGQNRAVGASGAIFGLLGAICYLVVRAKQLGLPPSILPDRKSLMKTLLLNLAISLLPMISMAAHLGGFVAGFVCTHFVLRHRKARAVVAS